MRTSARWSALAAALTLAPAAAAQDGPSGFACTFKSGSTIGYAKGVYRARPAATLSFVIGDIDLDGQKAALVLGVHVELVDALPDQIVGADPLAIECRWPGRHGLRR